MTADTREPYSEPPAGSALRNLWWVALPPLSLAISALMAISAGQATHTTLPALVPVLVIHYWTAHDWPPQRPRALPIWLVFACGLFVDAFARGPWGQWALIALCAQQTAQWTSDMPKAGRLRNALTELASLILTLVTATGLQAVIAMSFAIQPLPLADALVSIGCALLLYPLIAAVLALATPGLAVTPTGPKRAVFGKRSLFAGRNVWVSQQARR